VSAAVDVWVRYLVPLTVLSAVALLPVIAIALRVKPPSDAAGAHAIFQLGWALLALVWLGQLLLIGGAAAIARARPRQLRAFGVGLAQLARALVPCLAVVAGVAIGGLALAIPGAVLVVLLALTGASREPGVGALRDSIAAAHRRLPVTAIAVVAMLALDVAIVAVGQRVLTVPLSKIPAAGQLASLPHFLRIATLALVLVSPIPASVLATLKLRAE
jgi:hypothetical protein